jgi:hypothetical protein
MFLTCETFESAWHPRGRVDLNENVVARTDIHLQKSGPKPKIMPFLKVIIMLRKINRWVDRGPLLTKYHLNLSPLSAIKSELKILIIKKKQKWVPVRFVYLFQKYSIRANRAKKIDENPRYETF